MHMDSYYTGSFFGPSALGGKRRRVSGFHNKTWAIIDVTGDAENLIKFSENTFTN